MLINKAYTFNTIAPAVLGSQLRNLMLTQILNFEEAIKLDTNLFNTNSNVYKSLSATVVPSPAAFTFYVFKDTNGEMVIIAHDWIESSSIIEDDKVALFRLEFTNITLDDLTMVQQRIRDMGITNFSGKMFQ